MKQMNGQIIFALVLIVMGSIGGILLVVFQSQRSAKDKEEIISLNRQLLEKSEELNKFLGASDAFPILLISSGSSENGKLGFTFTIKNESGNPIYDIDIVVMDFDIIISKSMIKENKYYIKRTDFVNSIVFRKDISHLSENSDIITSELFQYMDNILYIKLKSRNNFVFEKIAFVTIGKTIYHGFMIYDSDGKVLKEWFGEKTTDDIQNKLRERFNKIPKRVSMSLIN